MWHLALNLCEKVAYFAFLGEKRKNGAIFWGGMAFLCKSCGKLSSVCGVFHRVVGFVSVGRAIIGVLSHVPFACGEYSPDCLLDAGFRGVLVWVWCE